MSIEEITATETAQEVEISYTEQSLIEKISAYGLKPKQILLGLKVNKKQLAQVAQAFSPQAASLSNAYLSQLVDALNNWQACNNFSDFTNQINQLIYLWLNAIHDGASTQTILRCIRCFQLKSIFGINQSSKLHCFLFELVAETTQKHHFLQLDYALNFDANTQLPHANQLLLDVENSRQDNANSPFISVFSLRFQVAKNNPIFSHMIAMSLSKKIASILLHNIPADHKLYFSGHLQFDLLIPTVKNNGQLNILAAKLSRVFEELIFLEAQSVLVTPSPGRRWARR